MDMMNTSSRSRSSSRRKERPLTAREKHFQGLVLLFVLIAVGLYFLWQWMKTHIWQSVLGVIVIVAILTLALWKFPKFRESMGGAFWSKLLGFLKPPEETEKDKKILEGKYTKVPPLPQGDKDRLIVKVGNKCEVCPQTYSLDVHHITPRSEGGSNKENNLIVVCPTCHRAAHSGGIPKSRLQYIARHR